MLRTITSLIVLIITTSLLLACTKEPTESLSSEGKETSKTSINSDKNQHKGFKSVYQKPGAGVRLKHNYDGHSTLGEPELLQLIFSESYSTGTLNIDLKTDQGLVLLTTDHSFSYGMQNQHFHELDISINPLTEGKHYLQIFVSATENNGSLKHRVFAIPFYVGDSFLQRKQQAIETDKSSAGNMIYLPSTEAVVQ